MKVTGLVVFMVVFTVIANLLLKQGAMVPAAQRIFFGIYSWKSVFGFAAFACAGLAYAAVMRWLPLNVATSFAAIQFVAVILASAVILSEPIPALRWLGIGLIIGGIVLVGSTTSFSKARETQVQSGGMRDG